LSASRNAYLAGVVIVEDNVHDLVLLQDVGIGVVAIDRHIGRIRSRRERRVQRGHDWRDVGDIVKEGTAPDQYVCLDPSRRQLTN
jgi:hypothetical protein